MSCDDCLKITPNMSREYEVLITDPADQPPEVTGATVTMKFYPAHATEDVGSLITSLTLTDEGAGIYKGTLQPSDDFTIGDFYKVRIEADTQTNAGSVLERNIPATEEQATCQQ